MTDNEHSEVDRLPRRTTEKKMEICYRLRNYSNKNLTFKWVVLAFLELEIVIIKV